MQILAENHTLKNLTHNCQSMTHPSIKLVFL